MSQESKAKCIVPDQSKITIDWDEEGRIVLRQIDPQGDEDHVIVIARENARTVAGALLSVIGEKLKD